jgi:hypothetical protein
MPLLLGLGDPAPRPLVWSAGFRDQVVAAVDASARPGEVNVQPAGCYREVARAVVLPVLSVPEDLCGECLVAGVHGAVPARVEAAFNVNPVPV